MDDDFDNLTFDEDTVAKLMGFDGTWHPCAAGCGEKLVRANIVCGACEDKAKAALEERDRARAVLWSIPETYRWATFDSPDLAKRVGAGREDIELLRAKVADGGRFVLFGEAGSGKTSLACALLRAWPTAPRHGITPIFVHAYELGVARIQSPAGCGEAHAVERAMRAPVLLIDDVGSERPTQTNAVPDVIVRRHADGLPTIVTTGATMDALAALYGGGVVRRIFEGAVKQRLVMVSR